MEPKQTFNKFEIAFPDPVLGFTVPLVIPIYGLTFDDAYKRYKKVIEEAEQVKVKGHYQDLKKLVGYPEENIQKGRY